MVKDRLITEIKKLWKSPEPERKKEFFQILMEQKKFNRHTFVMSHGEFLLNQFSYVPKWIWALSILIFLLITGGCYRNPESCPFALTPLLAAGILIENRRSYHYKMAELEYAARYSLRSITFARMFLVGMVDTIGILIVMWAVRPMLTYSLIQVFFYLMVPYLTASLAGSVFERKHRTGSSLGSIMICILFSAFYSAAPLFCHELYEERVIMIWGIVFVLLCLSMIENIRRWNREMEEPVWN